MPVVGPRAAELTSDITELDIDLEALRLDDGKTREKKRRHRNTQLIYHKACEMYGVTPVHSFVTQTFRATVNLASHQLKPPEVRPIAIALVRDQTISTLDLSHNDLGPLGTMYMAEMLQENTMIMDLNLSYTNPGREGVKALTETLKHNTCINSLRLEGNQIEHTEAPLLAELIQGMPRLRELYLGHNNLGYSGGKSIAVVLKTNTTLMTLDLRWNHLRRDSAVELAKALSRNTTLRVLNLAWNGLAKEGCLALAKSLPENSVLQELDLTCNRIDMMALGFLLYGLVRNSGLKTLKLGCNPLTTEGAKKLLRALKGSAESGIREVDLQDVPVDVAFTDLVKELQTSKSLRVTHGVERETGTKDQTRDHDPTNIDRYDPLLVLFEYMRMDNLRLIDMFKSFDFKKRDKLNKADFREGLKVLKIPLTEFNLETLVTKMDANKDGFIDLEEMMKAQRETSRNVNLRLLRAKARGREDQGILSLRDILRGVIQKRKDEQQDRRESLSQAAQERRQSMYGGGPASPRKDSDPNESKGKAGWRKLRAMKKLAATKALQESPSTSRRGSNVSITVEIAGEEAASSSNAAAGGGGSGGSFLSRIIALGKKNKAEEGESTSGAAQLPDQAAGGLSVGSSLLGAFRRKSLPPKLEDVTEEKGGNSAEEQSQAGAELADKDADNGETKMTTDSDAKAKKTKKKKKISVPKR